MTRKVLRECAWFGISARETYFVFLHLGVLLIFCADAMAAAPVDVLNVDLAPLIDKSASKRERIRRQRAAGGVGRDPWAMDKRWVDEPVDLAVRVPTLCRCRFMRHRYVCRKVRGSRSRAARTPRPMFAEDVRRGDLWGRPLLGDTLTFTLTVNANQASQVQLEISSLQAGYRGLSREVPDHAHYKSLQAKTNSLSATCTQNYACNATDANRGPCAGDGSGTDRQCRAVHGHAAQQHTCRRPSLRPDARHCQTGELAGGDPGIASAVTIYWESVSPCGEILGTFYSHTTMTQSGARTLVEQQDAWLIELEQAPRIAQPFFAGWTPLQCLHGRLLRAPRARWEQAIHRVVWAAHPSAHPGQHRAGAIRARLLGSSELTRKRGLGRIRRSALRVLRIVSSAARAWRTSMTPAMACVLWRNPRRRVRRPSPPNTRRSRVCGVRTVTTRPPRASHDPVGP
jgi:hypothetical protein